MKFNFKKNLLEETGPEGYMGFEADAEVTEIPYQGMSDPRNSMGAFGSMHQNQKAFKPLKTIDQQQLDQLQSSVFAYLAGEFLDPRQALYNVKVKLNHMGLDFTFNKNIVLNPGPVTFKLSRFGEKFGTTPTTDLSKGFDRGTDYTDSALSFDLVKSPSGKYYFRNVRLEQAQGGLQIENFFNQIASDEHLYENIMKPIMLNLLEKAMNEDLTEEVLERQLGFIIERSAKKLGVELNEESSSNLTKALYRMMLEQSGSEKAEGSMDRINKMAKASGKDVVKMRREKRKLAIQRMKEEQKKTD